jgi:hypothetical protein
MLTTLTVARNAGAVQAYSETPQLAKQVARWPVPATQLRSVVARAV